MSEKASIEYGFALGGGGAKAFAELGAIKAFEEIGIVLSYFSGSSMGTVFSVLLSAGYTVDEIMTLFLSKKRLELFSLSFFCLDNGKIGKLVASLCEKKGYSSLESLPRKAYAAATIRDTGQKVILKKGSIEEVVLSSTAAYGIKKHLVKDIAIRREVLNQSLGLFGKQRWLYLEDSCYTANVPFELLDEIRIDEKKGEPRLILTSRSTSFPASGEPTSPA